MSPTGPDLAVSRNRMKPTPARPILGYRILEWTLYGLLLAVLAKAAADLLFSTFMIYDDEGYVLITLRNAFTAGPLFDEVYTQYGPFFYLWHKGLAALGGWEWTNTTGRWITWFYWLGLSGLCADLVRRLSGSVIATLSTLSITFTAVWVMINEPMHPGGMIAFLVALAAWLGVWRDPSRHAWSAAAIAMVGTALALSKINTGLFLLAALWCWLVLAGRDTRTGKAVALLTAALLLVGPMVVMNGLLDTDWVTTFAQVSALALVTTYAVGWRSVELATDSGRVWRAVGLGGLAVAVAITGTTLALGTSPGGLLNGVLLGPLRHPGAYSFPILWRPGTRELSLLIAILIVAALRWSDARWINPLIHTLRAALALALIAAIWQWLPASIIALGVSYALPLSAVLAYPLIKDKAATGRFWIAMLLTWQALHAYPVAGSQLNWGTFLWVPLMCLAAHESLRCVPPVSFRRWALGAAAAAGLLGGGRAAAELAIRGWHNQHAGDRLELPGAESLLLPSRMTSNLQFLTRNASAHISTLFSLTGVYSFNLWTGLPTPTLANATHWFSLLSPAEQQAIINRLENDPRAGVIVQLDVVRFLLRDGRDISGPLVDFLTRNFTPVLEIDGYGLWLKKDRQVEILGLARWSSPGTLHFSLSEPLPEFSAVELWELDDPFRHRLVKSSPGDYELRLDHSPTVDSWFGYTLDLPTGSPGIDGVLIFRDEAGDMVQSLRVPPWPAEASTTTGDQ